MQDSGWCTAVLAGAPKPAPALLPLVCLSSTPFTRSWHRPTSFSPSVLQQTLLMLRDCREFKGIFVDANAISDSTMREIASLFPQASNVVDGSIIGWHGCSSRLFSCGLMNYYEFPCPSRDPPTRAGMARLLLSGPKADLVARLFQGSLLEAKVVGNEIGQASLIKMCNSANHKGHLALLFCVRALASKYGIDEHLMDEWAISQPEFRVLIDENAAVMPAKAWRYLGEMDEAWRTFAEARLPHSFFAAARHTFERLVGFRGTLEGTTAIADITSSLLDHA
eukprot:m.291293 g.291293  ORF g.291293 m.291293 type:complete len:280 (+) comp55094_c0_seq1:86-925(+)